MKDVAIKSNIYYFVDESGDPCFYDKYGNYIVGQEGCSKMLMLGFIAYKKRSQRNPR
jgi:hypothetical protein